MGPEGIVNIKYRRDKQLETMARLDPEYGALRKQLADKSLTPDQISDVKVKATAREQLLLPVYMQVSLQFADLHDRAGRMKAKDVIRQSLVNRFSNLRPVVEVVPVVASTDPVVIGGGVVGLVVGVSGGVVELASLGVLASGLGVEGGGGLSVKSLEHLWISPC